MLTEFEFVECLAGMWRMIAMQHVVDCGRMASTLHATAARMERADEKQIKVLQEPFDMLAEVIEAHPVNRVWLSAERYHGVGHA